MWLLGTADLANEATGPGEAWTGRRRHAGSREGNSIKAASTDDSIMYFAIGFLVAALSLLVGAPLVHARAVRLARRIEDAIPASVGEFLAEKDLQRHQCGQQPQRH